MLNFQRFRLILWFGMLTLPAVWVGKAESATINRRVSVQPIQVCNNSGLSCATMKFFESETDKIWSQAGIDIQFLPARKLNKTNFLTIDNLSEVLDLFTNPGNQQNQNDLFLNMWFVDELKLYKGGTTLGYTHPSSDPRNIAIAKAAFTFNNGIGQLDTIAHEIGHALELGHTDFGAGGLLNLMTDGGTRRTPTSINDISPNGAKTDQLTTAQINKARSSKYARPISGSSNNQSVANAQSFRSNVVDNESGADYRSFMDESVSTGLEGNAETAASVPEPSATLVLIGVLPFGLYMRLNSKRKCFRNT